MTLTPSSSARSSATWPRSECSSTTWPLSECSSKLQEEHATTPASTPSPTPPPSRERRLSRPTLPPPLPSETPSAKWTRAAGFWRSFVAICVPLLLSALEGSVTNTALPTISDALNLGTKFSWVATAFLLASTIFQPLYSQLGDMWGRKYPMMVAVAVFAVGSAICGAANSGAVLILGRIVQGLGTGGIDLFAEMVLCDIVPLRKRGPYLAIKHAVFAVGTTLGPLLGGVFAEHGWRWCFLVNIPVCGIALVILWLWLNVSGGTKAPNTTLRDELKKVDVCGTTLLTSAVVMLLVALSTGGAPHPWTHAAILTPLVLGLLGLLAFPVFERSRWCAHPIMPPRIFANRTSNIAYALTTLHGFITYGFQFYLPPFFQAVKGSSPTTSGLQVLPTTLAIVVMASIGGPLLTVWGKYKPLHILGFGAMALGLGLATTLDSATPVAAWLAFQLVVAVGSGIVISTMLPAVQVKLPEGSTAASAGSWAFLRGTGSLFGVAVPGALFNARFAALLPGISSAAARSQLAHGQAYQRASSVFVRKFGAAAEREIVAGFAESLRGVWIVFAACAAVGFCAAWGEKQYKMRKELNTAYGLKAPKSASAATSPGSSVAGSGACTPVAEKGSEDVELGGGGGGGERL
ncbi:MFS general substrate transporter [Trematosphaeria pertusa]|uniref:MFS general substrate transporter n=1 Tax=Trematosphaeria pertusa TaxID=390896 RepID=A0A6A6HVS7_9PLEO|nr:MFS general substrate transporter [Trematosphaeria pertusa]KAF2242294.1 MFS general substrate transporter [Trematosphaeria pertusa]